MLMRPSKVTAVHGCHSPDDMHVRMACNDGHNVGFMLNSVFQLDQSLFSLTVQFSLISRAPHERKKKDLAKVKRVRARRENTTLTEEGEQELDNSIVNDPMDKMDEVLLN